MRKRKPDETQWRGVKFLVRETMKRTGTGEREVNIIIKGFISALVEALVRGDEVFLPNVGKFSFRVRKARTRPPQIMTRPDGSTRSIPGFSRQARYVKFAQSNTLKRLINDPENQSATWEAIAAKVQKHTRIGVRPWFNLRGKAEDSFPRYESAPVSPNPDGAQHGEI